MKTVVIGGGIAGLTVARARQRAGVETLLLERGPEPGGVIRSVRRDGFLLETGPNTVRPTPELLDLVAELALGSELLVSDPRLPRYVDFRGRLYPLPTSPLALITTRLLSLSGKLGILAEPLRRRPAPPEESVRDFFTRRFGPEVADRVVAPFISGIFAGDASRLSAPGAFPALTRWEREAGSVLLGAIRGTRASRGGTSRARVRGLLSFREGLSTLPRAMARSLGNAFRAGAAVDRIGPAAGRFAVRDARGEIEADEVILAAPAADAANLVRPFAPEAAAALDSIEHPPLAVLHLAWPLAALRRPLAGFGHLVVPDASRRILGAVWSSGLFPGRAPEGQALLTVFLGGVRDPETPRLPDGRLVDLAVRDLEAEGLVRGAPSLLLATRWERSIPQYTNGHASRMEALARAETRWPGLKFAGNYRGGISVGDVVKAARAV
jgi:protoporphyrinogen/coproporphyrinogen III oxidase